MQDHDEVYDKLLEEAESVRGQQKKGTTPKPPEKNRSPSEDTEYPTIPPKKAKSVVKIAALEAGGDISQEKDLDSFSKSVKAKMKSNPLRKNLELEQEKMSTLPKDSQQDFVPKNAKDLLKSYRLASGGKVKSASARADGCAIRGKTRA
jgi:hypothetical protein